MRSRVPFALVFTAIMLFIAMLPGSDGAMTLDPYEIVPGTFIPLKLSDFDEKGDVLTLTITFKGSSAEDYEPRGIDILILDQSRADKTTRIEIAETEAFFVMKNVSIRVEKEIKNPTNGKKSIVFYNPSQKGDDKDWDNATVRIRIDYEVKNKEEGQGLDILPIVVIALVVIIIILVIFMGFYYFKRRSKDARTFFNPQDGPYYAFRSMIDGKVYYIDPDQYARLYESNSLGNYDFLGTATRIGGPITPPEGSQMENAMSGTTEGPVLTPIPIVGDQPQVDIASMEAIPISPSEIGSNEDYKGLAPSPIMDEEGKEPVPTPSVLTDSEPDQRDTSVADKTMDAGVSSTEVLDSEERSRIDGPPSDETDGNEL